MQFHRWQTGNVNTENFSFWQRQGRETGCVLPRPLNVNKDRNDPFQTTTQKKCFSLKRINWISDHPRHRSDAKRKFILNLDLIGSNCDGFFLYSYELFLWNDKVTKVICIYQCTSSILTSSTQLHSEAHDQYFSTNCWTDDLVDSSMKSKSEFIGC